MADVESRREARRKKILQNADKRMKRLTNQSENEDIDNNKDFEKPTDTSSNAIKEEDFIQKNSIPIDPKTDNAKPKVEQTELRHRGTVKIQRNINASKPEEQISEETSKSTDISPKSANYTVKQIESLKISSLVLLAIVCRLVLNCGIGLLYFKSIFLPFCIAEACWIHYQLKNSLEVPRKSNMMSTVLMLCGIKKELLVIYDRIMGYVTTFSEDFGLFVFSFFISDLNFTLE